jgi:transcriptional regulator with XRE-family HTH domain
MSKRQQLARERIRAIRLSRNMSQRELARLCGIGNVTICRIEKGVVENPTTETLKAIAKVLKVPLAEIA